MSRGNELLERMRRTKTGWKFSDLDALYLSFGFEKHEGGKHTMYIHPIFPELRATVTRHRNLAIGYIQYGIKLIDSLKDLERRMK